MKKMVSFLTLASITATQAAVFSSGELDFGVILEGGELELEAHVVSGVVNGVQTDDVEFEVSSLTVLAGADRQFSAMANLPAAGVMTGDSLWILPQSQVAGVPYVALASEELTAGDWSTSITFSLGTVTSPTGTGTFSMWTNDGLGNPTFYFSSADAAATDDNNQFVSSFSHDHVNWGFNEPGEWLVELTAAGTHNTLGALTATETLSFRVIPEPSTSLLASLSILGLIARRKRQSF